TGVAAAERPRGRFPPGSRRFRARAAQEKRSEGPWRSSHSCPGAGCAGVACPCTPALTKRAKPVRCSAALRAAFGVRPGTVPALEHCPMHGRKEAPMLARDIMQTATEVVQLDPSLLDAGVRLQQAQVAALP